MHVCVHKGMCTCLYVCAHFCVRVYTGVHTPICRDYKRMSGVLLCHPRLIPLRQDPAWNLELDWRSESSRSTSVSPAQYWGYRSVCSHTQFFTLKLGFELRSSCLCSEYSYPEPSSKPLILFLPPSKEPSILANSLNSNLSMVFKSIYSWAWWQQGILIPSPGTQRQVIL